jgi:hypothetical protein
MIKSPPLGKFTVESGKTAPIAIFKAHPGPMTVNISGLF